MVPLDVVQQVLGVEVGGPAVLASSPCAVTRPIQPRPGADVDRLRPTLLRGQVTAEVLQHVPNVGIGAILRRGLLLGGGLGAAFGARLAAAAGDAAGRTGGTLGGCGKCSIPHTGNCSSTQRRHASANFSRSPSTFHLDVENARSHGPMFSAMTRRRASPPLYRRKRVAAAPATVPWRYSASPPSPLTALRCRASRSAGRTVSTVPSPRSYRRSAEEWGSNADTTQHHARDTLCSSASEAAGLLLEDCAAGALGRAAA